MTGDPSGQAAGVTESNPSSFLETLKILRASWTAGHRPSAKMTHLRDLKMAMYCMLMGFILVASLACQALI